MLNFLWVGCRQGTWDLERFTLILKKYFALAGLDQIGLRAWRQASVSIAHAHLSGKIPQGLMPTENGIESPADDPQDLSRIMDRQRNHTSHTANMLYGHSSGVGVVRDSESNFLLASQVWQQFWGVSLYPCQSCFQNSWLTGSCTRLNLI